MLTRHLVALKPIRYERVEYKIGDTIVATPVDANYFLTRGLAKEKPVEPKKFKPAPEPRQFEPEVAQIVEPVIEPVMEPVVEPTQEPAPEPIAAEAPAEPAPTPRRRGRPRSILNSIIGTRDEE